MGKSIITGLPNVGGFGNLVNPTIYGGISYGGAGESGVSFTDLNSLLYSGFYTCYGTTANVPNSSTSWFIEHINSNTGTATATQFAYAYNDNKVIYKRTKTSGTWGSWEKINLPSRIQNVDNSSYFEAGGNVNNTVGDTEQETFFTQFKAGTGQGHRDITNAKTITGVYGKDETDGECFRIQVIGLNFPSTELLQQYTISENRTNEDEVAKISDIPKVVSETDVVVAVEDWVADTTYTDYDYKADLTLTGMLSTYEPNVIFGLAEVETGNYASVCLAGNDTITIYAKEIPSASITLPLIKGEQL